MTSEDKPESPDHGTVGRTLRKAREAAGLTVNQVAQDQHLRPSVIQYIENGDYEQIESELFLKGYVRTYAGLVGLNQNEVIADLDDELEPLRKEREQAQQVNPLQDIERRKRHKKRIARSVFLVVVVLGIGIAAWRYTMLSQDADSPAVPAEKVSREPTQVSPEQPEPSALMSPGDEPAVKPIPDPLDEAPVAEDVAEDEGEVIPAEQAVLEEPSQATDANVADLGESASAPAVSSTASLETSTTSNVIDPQVSQVTGVADSQVRLIATFTNDCWVQVTDANGQTLVSSLRRSGGRINVAGQPPLRIVFGAADAVERVEFSGETVDMSPYRVVNNRVEFSLDI
ncbi:RodZ domain-containing protein [Marinobacter caseinilyticus]|uniref:RodZ domain-containing protein n=1 Tax=Marinobacter caseinilyticus TaxID=2692195 RepID=UPI00140AAEE5|nr:RodZ family helix-turn-helix domain-containing protein [Marinobacter caseinilyticus]